MCGRFYMPEKDIDDFAALIEEIEEELLKPKNGEFRPGDRTPVVVPGRDRSIRQPEIRLLTWGFPLANANRPLINARSETVMVRPAFRNAYLSRRCLIPSRGFYEWEKTTSGKVKNRFFWPDESMMWLAGLYWFFRNNAGALLPAYTILTTDANAEVAAIHDRMPVVLREQDHVAWLFDEVSAQTEQLMRPLPDGSLSRLILA